MTDIVKVAQSVAMRRRRLVSSLKEELLSTVSSMIGYSQILNDDSASENHSQELSKDLQELLGGTKELYRFLKQVYQTDWQEIETDEFDERFRMTRHDTVNQLNHTLGLCQLLLLDKGESFLETLVDDLELIESKSQSCVTTIQRYKDVDLESGGEGDGKSILQENTFSVLRKNSEQSAIFGSTVLVVDDQERNRIHLQTFLEKQGAQVGLATNGREALSALRSDQEYDLVLLDLNMPEMNGFEVLREVAKDERLQQTPIIIVSGFTETEHVAACIEMGADDHLPKPVDFRLLTARANSCLEKKKLREREFAQFFTPELARYYVRHPELLMKGRDMDVTIMFCDIRGFSNISERLGPADTVSWLSDVMGRFSDCVIRHHGVLVDYLGDELMAMWGAPQSVPNHAELACDAAVDILEQLPSINAIWQDKIQGTTEVGIGLNSGIARVGNTGSHRKFKYGPLGNTVNLASRVEGATKHLGTNLLVTDNTYNQLSNKFASRRLGKVKVVNINSPVDLYEIVPQAQLLPSETKMQYEQALAYFEERKATKAASTLSRLLVDHPDDGPSLLLMSRVIDFLLQHGENFDPVWELPGK